MRVNEMLAVHAELRATIAVLRKQHGGLLKQLQRAHARIASLGNDARHISHSAQAELDDGARAEAKLERSRNEYAYELEQHADESSALARTADELERALLENLGLADADAERSKQAEYTRVRARRERELELENRLGKLGETRAYLEAKLATVCQLVALKDEHLTVRAARGGRARGAAPRDATPRDPAWREGSGRSRAEAACPTHVRRRLRVPHASLP
jgi:outer membrane murein-binding lipoprotein Lpp